MCERFTDAQKRECNGGQGCCIYKLKDELVSFNKKDHAERSLANQPNHIIYWNKQKNERKIESNHS